MKAHRTTPRIIGTCQSLIREFDGSFARFALVGLSNFAVSFSVFRGLVAISGSFEYKATVSQIASYAAGTIWSFIWNRRFTFRSTDPILGQGTRFVVLQASLAAVSSGLIGLFVDIMSFPASPTWFVVMGFITIGNYFLCKRWVFR